MLSQLSHRRVLIVYGVVLGSSGYPKWIVTELATDSLRGMLNKISASGRKLDTRMLIKIAKQVIEGLEFMHRPDPRAVLHRDIKPENVLVFMDDGTTFFKLADVGIAKVCATAGIAMGGTCTPMYAAPEIALRCGFDGRVDVFSLGIMLIECVLGYMSDRARTMDEYEEAGVSVAAADAATVLTMLGFPEFAAFVKRCCEINPDMRYTSAEALDDVTAMFEVPANSRGLVFCGGLYVVC